MGKSLKLKGNRVRTQRSSFVTLLLHQPLSSLFGVDYWLLVASFLSDGSRTAVRLYMFYVRFLIVYLLFSVLCPLSSVLCSLPALTLSFPANAGSPRTRAYLLVNLTSDF